MKLNNMKLVKWRNWKNENFQKIDLKNWFDKTDLCNNFLILKTTRGIACSQKIKPIITNLAGNLLK